MITAGAPPSGAVHRGATVGGSWGPLFFLGAQELLCLASLFSQEEGSVLLFSGGERKTAKRSFLFLFPFQKLLVRLGQVPDPWESLKSSLGPLKGASGRPEWVGYLGYEMGAVADRDLPTPYFQSKTPDAYFQRSVLTLELDHESSQARVYLNEEGLDSLEKSDQILCQNMQQGILPEASFSYQNSQLRLLEGESQEAYHGKIEEVLRLIRLGDVYQTCISRSLDFAGTSHPFSLFWDLNQENPASFSAFLKIEDFSIVCSSPERFLECRQGRLETRPIKGTVPRGTSVEEDNQQKQKLLHSEKERAELLMITDLLRNDLGRVAQPGSVKVKELFACESYSNVHHLLSVIEALQSPHWHPLDILRQCFPGGSISGCPKLRALVAIHELEQRPRGIFTGSIGYFAENGDFDFNIVIRTVICEKERVNLQVGGGIVYDSNVQLEYEETCHKVSSILKAMRIGEH